MALARLALKNLRSRVVVSPPPPPPPAAAAFLSDHYLSETTSTNGAVGLEKQTACWSSQLVKRFTTTTTTTPSDDDHGQNSAKPDDLNLEVAATANKPSNNKLFPRRKRRQRGGGLWNWWSRGDHNDRDFLPSLDLSGIGNALVQATRNINMLLENLSPSHLMGRFKEKDECYKIKFHMPGLSKEEVKITIQDGILVVRGEHKEEGEEDSDDEHWSYASQGYYSSSMLLPEDAKVDEIKAEMKDGVLCINIPKAEGKKKDVKEVQVY